MYWFCTVAGKDIEHVTKRTKASMTGRGNGGERLADLRQKGYVWLSLLPRYRDRSCTIFWIGISASDISWFLEDFPIGNCRKNENDYRLVYQVDYQ